ncbi:hypothetical protein BWQ96_09858 [Gracilariopsis chorda]|uniref:AIG1-type G domain-containing protein n=1 Tax=Gracilariopsis chorda TaxID=448386 RepID=A0A2V3IH09_9FLOR|nr:hypothetical protein BWQ96_09858 [Gracilariopsis chorda]|eukprot:PXF40430.1 hypothetical protein BWQ96_09858 [Gracilariopsis chorda]
MVDLLNPIGFLADSIAIANALGLYTPAQKANQDKLHNLIESAKEDIQMMNEEIKGQCDIIKSQISAATVVEVRSRLQDIAIPPEKLELLIVLCLCMKAHSSTVVFAIVVKYPVGRISATLGFAGMSCDRIEDFVKGIDRFYRTLQHVNATKTAYVNVRIRGKYDTETESLSTYGDEPNEYDQLRRVYLVGNTRSGKSTLGNALLRKSLFTVSKRMTGTMRIERGERVEELNGDIWRTDYFDTPGLNDKDGLDVWYQSAIEDHIKTFQRASTLIMTVSADSGINGAAFQSLGNYKELFGQSMASMLIVVLTVNDAAEESELELVKALNLPTVAGLDARLDHQNVFCVSLYDLRHNYDSASRRTVQRIASRCKSMSMKLVEALADRYRSLQNALREKRGSLEKELTSLIDEGWQAYDQLTEQFENSAYVKLTADEDGWFDGFVMKKTSPSKKSMAFMTAGVLNRIRKFAIHVNHDSEISTSLWNRFLEENKSDRHNRDLMWFFGDLLDRKGLAVVVQELGTVLVGSLRVNRFTIRIFDPVHYTHDELHTYLQEKLDENAQCLRPEVLGTLLKSVVPAKVVTTKGRKGKRKKRSALHGTN